MIKYRPAHCNDLNITRDTAEKSRHKHRVGPVTAIHQVEPAGNSSRYLQVLRS
jgi:hypothetical protein